MTMLNPGRRAVLKSGLALAAAASAGPALGASSVFVLAQTEAGRIRGIDVDGVKQFRGVPYGASTAGKGRFRPPRPPRPWRGVREAYGYGEITPQPYSSPTHPFGDLIDFDLHVGPMGEDCLNLNIWTPGVRDGGKRPVLVYFHGGGMSSGSGNHDLYVGDRLARYADVVVVTVNHRLSAFGYLNLADLGAPAEFADSGNAGILDLERSLAWVRDNIAEFGGDPGKVMIFGQSGGGTKVACVMAMPTAQTLYHRAAIQSGGTFLADREQSADAARALLRQLGVGRGEWRKLQELPAEALVEAQVAIGSYDWISGRPAARPSPQFTPLMDGRSLPHGLASPGAIRLAATKPLIVGYCLADRGWTQSNFDLDEAGLRTVADQISGGRGERCMEIYARDYPHLSPFVVQGIMLTDQGVLPHATALAERRARAGGDTFVYRFDWPSKAAGGRFGATHGMDMSLVFHNTHQPTLGGDTPEAREMADLMSTAWVTFARAGRPQAPTLPDWRAYSADKRETMVINSPHRRLVNDPNRDGREFWPALAEGAQ